MAQQPKVFSDNLNFTIAQAKNVEAKYAKYVNERNHAMKHNEYRSQTEGRVINQLNDNVLSGNPSNSLYSHTIINFNKAYSQEKRTADNYIDCSAFVSSGMRQQVREMIYLKDSNGKLVFNTSDLHKVNKAFSQYSTTITQEMELRSIYQAHNAKPAIYKGGDSVKNAIFNETEVGKILIMDKDGYMRTPKDRHVWVSVRDPNTNKIAWAESTIGTGVILSSPAELWQRNSGLKTKSRQFTLFDPFIGENRKIFNEYDKQSMAFTVAYHTNKSEMQSKVTVSGNSEKVDINYYPNFMNMQNRLLQDKHNIENLNIQALQGQQHRNSQTKTFGF